MTQDRKPAEPDSTGSEPIEKQPKGEPPAQDPHTGKFLPGNNGGPGRPRSFDFQAAVRKFAMDKKIDLEKTIGLLLSAMIEEATARNGSSSVTAAKLLWDRLCGPVKQSIELEGEIHAPPMPPMPDGEHLPEYLERLRRAYKEAKVLDDDGDDS